MAYIPFQAYTLTQLARDLHEKYGTQESISDPVRTLILCDILKDRNIGYARILSALLKKIRHYMPHKDLAQVREEIGHLIFEEKAAQRADTSLDILQLYEDRLRTRQLLDPDDILKESISAIQEHLSPSLVIIDGFYDPSGLECEIIGALMDKAEQILILAEEKTDVLKHVLSLNPDLETQKVNGPALRTSAVHYVYPSMEDEVEGIARNIKKLILEGVNPWEITVSFPVLEKYLPMTRRVFRKQGVPVSIGHYNLSATGPLITLGELITCIEEDYPRTDFLSLLISPCLPAVPAVVKERAVSYAYRAGIVKGIHSWLSLKDILMNSIGDEISGREQELLGQFQEGLEFVTNIIEHLKSEKSLKFFAASLESALERLGFFDSPAFSRSAVQGDELRELIHKRLSELKQFADLCGHTPQNTEPPAFYLKYLLGSMQGSEENREGVKILNYELAAGVESRILFFGGMQEGDMPSRPDIDPILPEKVKKALGIPDLEYFLKRQKAYFMRLLNASKNDPWFSFPSAEGDKILLPSPYLEWGESMNPPRPDIFTEEDVLLHEGAARGINSEKILFGKEGMFSDRKTAEILRNKMNGILKGYISVTAIDYYRKCPLRFYVERVLDLEPEAPPRFEVESRLWGTLAHRVMEHVFTDGDIDLDDMNKRLYQGLKKSLKQFPVGEFWTRVAQEIFRKLSPLLREQENSIRREGFSPSLVEKSLKADIKGLKLKGKIDRVDVKAQRKEPETDSPVRLLDYKTGALDRDSLQMPLYAAMWQENFTGPVDKTGYYSLKEGRIDWYPKKKDMEDYVRNALEEANRLVENMKKGIFPATPFKEPECRYCSHKPFCSGSK